MIRCVLAVVFYLLEVQKAYTVSCSVEVGLCRSWALFAGGCWSAGRDALCATLYTGGCGGCAPCAGSDALCATPYARGCGGCTLLLEVPEVMCCVRLRMLEAVEGVLCLLEAPEVMRCVLLVCWML